MAADYVIKYNFCRHYVINVNVRFEQFARAVGIYSAKNPL